ncbi:coniferyl-aldehyde dehydrogenase [Rhizobium sp. RU35A]|uniref:coniferyl aldehyde dehydrogenase n=1 Tax=Rhizobium sp. RU35A TaxID=1907414 RepID=UPI00095702E8|nr:coniferyl aldehyde dehydrogenase [Rhizobium sp. RU35A]SIQ88004.1 coniferyl-aldehyde dehydrogenase [Rhizobium sp. RU35A]
MNGQTTMRAIFDRQHAASRREPAPDLAARRAALRRLEKRLVANADAIAGAIAQDFGHRSHDETRLLELLPAIRALRHARRHVAGWMRPRRRAVDIVFQPARAEVRHQPLGVVGIISPWNYPLLLSVTPLTDALAAGNRVMLKPSELTPAFSALLFRLIDETFSPDEVAVMTGGVEVAEAFSALPFDHLLFTGSTGVGRAVMRAAAENLTPVTLELGGKSPALVAPDYPLDKAAGSIALGKMLNAGQTCIAPDYALVPKHQVRAFAEAMIQAMRRRYPTLADNPDYSALLSARQRQRLAAALEEALNAGCTILTHGETVDAASAKMAPSVVIEPPAGSLLMREEIFGPVLPVIGYSDLDEALDHIRAHPRPLALYLFTHDRQVEETVLSSAISGGVTVNGTLLHVAQDNLPFGGIGPSGMGAYHGEAGFRRFSHARAVMTIGPVNMFERLGPPWGVLSRWLARVLGGIR